ncbi:MAG: hypothetical protein GY748_24270 [Planctomycetaceae bacterium]|nr:hypothetical protein [Planctomycetaceae bacterium]
MTESLEAGSCLIEALGIHLGIDATGKWQTDDVFLDLLKDKQTINAVLADIATKKIAQVNAATTGKVQKGIIRDIIKGENGRKKHRGWLPKYMRFPFKGHTEAPIETISIGASWLRIKAEFKGNATRKST